jgi:hypothetical protein
MNINNKKKNNILFTIIIFMITIIVIIIIVYLFNKLNIAKNKKNGTSEYQVLLPIKDDAKNMNLCLPGCVRGTCKLPNKGKNFCNYDFQCQYCQDYKTNMFYVNFDKEREIVPVYEEKSLNNKETQLLNDSIKQNNNYINLLNKKIQLVNS